ncbi:MAG: hypothetical protein C5B59_16595 [Bacteroidetes bacterium]|nr:MAG: hypothetical protein C5B59_16595 [Bacteroidota bacterium]
MTAKTAKWERRSIWKKYRAKIIIVSAAVAAVATFLANAKTISDFLVTLIHPKSVKLVSVSFPGKDSLDIKLRNTSSEVSFLKKIELTIKKRWILIPDDVSKAYVIPSSTYDIYIDTAAKQGDVLSKEITEDIEPNKTSRFLLRFGPSQKFLTRSYVYLADLALIYDEDNKTLFQKDVMFALIDPSAIYYSVQNSMVKRTTIAAVNEINQQEGIKSSSLIDLMDLFIGK